MTIKSIEEQISAIREVTERAAASPEAALDFLRRAGIVGVAKRNSKKSAKSLVYGDVVSHRYTYAAETRNSTHKDTTVTTPSIADKPGRRKSK
ncbi:MAG TPA: hypothetical protein VGN20_10790 [Mucilaginibacter sp.]|jgi:hypothetical protein